METPRGDHQNAGYELTAPAASVATGTQQTTAVPFGVRPMSVTSWTPWRGDTGQSRPWFLKTSHEAAANADGKPKHRCAMIGAGHHGNNIFANGKPPAAFPRAFLTEGRTFLRIEVFEVESQRIPPMPVDRSDYPWWVKAGLLGFPSRRAQWFFFWLSVALAGGFFIYAFWNLRFLYWGGLSIIAAIMYWLTIRWVDKNGEWGDKSVEWPD
jgi:hypothetical protein